MDLKSKIMYVAEINKFHTARATQHDIAVIPVTAALEWLAARAKEQQYGHAALDTAAKGSIEELSAELKELMTKESEELQTMKKTIRKDMPPC